MSIDSDLNRIATSLEEIIKHLRGGIVEAVTTQPATLGGRRGRPAPPTANPVAEVDADVPVATQEEVHAKLRGYMEKHGIDAAKKLMIKHGANAAKPVITSIPPANYGAIVKEIG